MLKQLLYGFVLLFSAYLFIGCNNKKDKLVFTLLDSKETGINFKTYGTYSIKAHYGETEKMIHFDFHKGSDTETEPGNNPIIKNKNESITVTEKNNSNIKSLSF